MTRTGIFGEWVDQFRKWQKDIGLTETLLGNYVFEAKYGEMHSKEIEFGDYAGRTKWESVAAIPGQRIREALENLIVVQGDTEFASSEQQRKLIDTAPSDHDLQCLLRVTREEMRHGWQMAHLLVNHFGRSGKVEAGKLLERRAYKGTRLLGAFNEPVEDWLDFFAYTAFIDRDGKYQLTMLSHSGFAPLARSIDPMLKEEAFHLFTGFNGLSRIIRAKVIPMELIQKYLNKWISVALDLFGRDHSSSAYWLYVWGLKGRFNEDRAPEEADKEHLNEEARGQYLKEVREVVDHLNKFVPTGRALLYVPNPRFHRSIGEFAKQPYSVYGHLLSPDAYQKHLAEALPGPEDRKRAAAFTRGKYWIKFPEESLRGTADEAHARHGYQRRFA
jgi:benzoyl-CoA 2,3-dioxygenase component B